MSVTYHHDIEQRSPEWYALRLGRLTASRAADMMATRRDGKPSASRQNLLVQLLLERITGRSQERQFQSQAMLDGIEREPEALAHYEALTGKTVWPVGFVSHDELRAGCSPDGLIGEDGILSIKSPIPATHLDYLKTGKVPHDYELQAVHELWLTGRTWVDWMSWQPAFPEGAQVKLVRLDRKDLDLDGYARQAVQFLAEVEREVQAFRTLTGLRETLQASVA